MANVKVTFMNETGTVLGVTDIDSAQLPETFAIETTLHLGADDWTVLSAKPLTAAEFTAAGELTLVINKIEKVSPDGLLFSMPTIANALPEFEGGLPPEGHVLDVHEDMWRQNEFLNKSSEKDVQEDLRAIQDIWDNYAVKGDNYTAFSKCHVRKFGDPALDISLHDVIDLLRSEDPVPLTLSGMPVLNGFGLRADSGLYYGIAEKGRVSVLCTETDETEIIQQVMKKFNLIFMDWCGCLTMQHK